MSKEYIQKANVQNIYLKFSIHLQTMCKNKESMKSFESKTRNERNIRNQTPNPQSVTKHNVRSEYVKCGKEGVRETERGRERERAYRGGNHPK